MKMLVVKELEDADVELPDDTEGQDPGCITAEMSEQAPAIRFDLLAFADVKIDRTTRRYLVKNLLPNSGLTVIWGPPKCGKSFWVMDLALHVALGWEYRGRRVQQAIVVYVALEGQAGMPDRIEAFRTHHGIAGAVPFYLLLTRLNLIADAPKLVADIKAQLGEGVTPGLIVLDTLNRSLVGSESRDEDMGKYLGAADFVAAKLASAVALVHHCGIDATRPRGHTSLTGSVECQIAAKRSESGHVETKVEYAKDFAEDAETVSRLELKVVGTDPDGDVMTSLVVLPSDHAAGPGRPKEDIRPAVQKALEALQNVLAGDQIIVLSGNRKAAHRDHWAAECNARGMIDLAGNTKSARTLMNTFRRELVAANRIACEEDFSWLL
jgi:AAA domain